MSPDPSVVSTNHWVVSTFLTVVSTFLGVVSTDDAVVSTFLGSAMESLTFVSDSTPPNLGCLRLNRHFSQRMPDFSCFGSNF